MIKPNKVINWARAVNREAGLIQITGDKKTTPCNFCAKGAGPFEGCFTAGNDIAQGACGNCHYNSEGRRCTFHTSEQQETLAKAAIRNTRAAETHKYASKSPKTDRKRKRGKQDDEEEDTGAQTSPLQHAPPAFNPALPPWANMGAFASPYGMQLGAFASPYGMQFVAQG